MLQTTIIPSDIIVSIEIPQSYVGKKMHALFYIEDEIDSIGPSALPKKPSDYFGTLSEEEGSRMHSYVSETRNEWNRNI